MAEGKNDKLVRVVELFAGVGGFRIGLEGASDAYKTVWNNQWEPSTKRQDASLVYQARFGVEGHSNKDINDVRTDDIPDHDLLVGGFPCQDYSVAATLSKSGGIEGKKGVLWWQIYRILDERKSMYDYCRSLIAFRKSIPAFAEENPNQIGPKVEFEDIGAALHVHLSGDGLGKWEELDFFFNPARESLSYEFKEDKIMVLGKNGDVSAPEFKIRRLLVAGESLAATGRKKKSKE